MNAFQKGVCENGAAPLPGIAVYFHDPVFLERPLASVSA
jgi:hypothetical protein